MGCIAAPTCRAALAEATNLWPNRNDASDGICGDASHQRRKSDHNDGNAWDLTHDPRNGCDAHALVEEIRRRRDPRVKYIISNNRICGPGSRGGGWEWKSYSGSNPHRAHTHVSIKASARGDLRPWFSNRPVTVILPPAPVKPTPPSPDPLLLEEPMGATAFNVRGPDKDEDFRVTAVRIPPPERGGAIKFDDVWVSLTTAFFAQKVVVVSGGGTAPWESPNNLPVNSLITLTNGSPVAMKLDAGETTFAVVHYGPANEDEPVVDLVGLIEYSVG